MKIVALYVDAENLNVEDVKSQLASIRSSLREDEVIQGKFYGGIGVLGSIINVCYNNGLEFVETSSLLQGQKNVTDIKLIIDCLQDVYEKKEKISRVILLSHDCDFTPLVYKLRSLNLNVLAPLFSISERSFSIRDVEKFLSEVQFHSPVIDKELSYFGCCYEELRDVLPDTFSDDLVKATLDKKKNRFLRSMRALCDDDAYEKLEEIPADQFSFFDVVDLVDFNKQIYESLVKLYTSKFYGYLFSSADLDTIVNALGELKIA